MGSKFKYFIFRWVPPILWMMVILLISATPEPFRFVKESSLDSQIDLPLLGHSLTDLFDYPYHFFVYFILGILIARALIWKTNCRFNFYVIAFSLLMIISLVDEFQQIAVPKRNFEIIDLVIDGLGGLSGILLYSLFFRKKLKKNR